MIGLAAFVHQLGREQRRLAALDVRTARHLNRLFAGNEDATWASARGDVRVHSMSDSHLHYAIAKGLRGEYEYPRDLRVLQIEVVRRILKPVFMPSKCDYADAVALGLAPR